MENFNVEIRDNRLHLSGYVNAVERDSRVIETLDGRCVEQIAAGAFAKSLEDGHEVRMKLNHKRCIGSTTDGTIVTLREDNVGLYAQTVTDDEELRTLAAQNRLTGWSFGFVKKDGSIEERGKDVPRRRITALDLTEISILSVTPAYYGNSVETREDTADTSAENEETRSCEDYELRSDGEPDQEEPAAEKTENGLDPEEVRAKVDQFLLGEKIKEIRRRGEEIRLRLAWLDIKEKGYELEERYNHYHDPHTGRFASGAGGGAGLYYSMGKGKGEIIGASSAYNSSIANNLVNRYNDKMNWISSDDVVKKIIKGGSSYGVEDAKEFLEKTQKSFEKYKKDIEQSGENSKYYRERMAAVNSALNRVSSVKNSLKNNGQQSFF